MIHSALLHPQMLKALASAGHGARILIADSNYSFTTNTNPHAERVFLNLAPGLVRVTDVLRVLAQVVPVEAAAWIAPDDGTEPAIVADYRALLPDAPLSPLTRFPFYEAARGADTALVVATGDQRLYACIQLIIGVIPPG